MLFNFASLTNIWFCLILYSNAVTTSNSCILPKHPRNGRWSIIRANSSFNPGQTISEGTFLNVRCNKRFRLKGSRYILCENGEWTRSIGNCLKICKSIDNSVSMTVTCLRNGVKLPHCRNALEGTIARIKCADFFEDLSLAARPPLYCSDGNWSNSLPNCDPSKSDQYIQQMYFRFFSTYCNVIAIQFIYILILHY